MASVRTPTNGDPAATGLVVAGDRPAKVVAFEAEIVGFFVDAAGLLGVPKSVAAIYGMVFASPEPLSFADIAARLDLSKGSVSQGLRVLREVGAIKEVSVESDRTELFEPDLEMRKLIARFISSRLQTQLTTGKDRLAALDRGISTLPSADRSVVRARLDRLESWHRRLLPVIRTFLKI